MISQPSTQQMRPIVQWLLVLILLSCAITSGSTVIVAGANTAADSDPGVWLDAGILASSLSIQTLHTAVWTGSEMIVWGGKSASSLLNTGARYNPATDTWTPISNAGAPEARNYHTAVWTGTEMIVWGGEDGSNIYNTGGRYNPVTDTWAPISTAGAPEARYHHTAVWTGTEMIVWGGKSASNFLNTGARYNPATDTWTPISTLNAPEARYYHTAVWTGSEMIVWGGEDGSNIYNTGGRYNPAADTWTPISTTNAPEARYLHTAVWTGSDMIVWGGEEGSNGFNTGGCYNPATDTWTPISITDAPDARYFHTAIWTGSEMIVWGGRGGNAAPPTVLNTGGRYNPATDTWTPILTLNDPDPRYYYYTAVWTGTEMIVWGGAYASSVLNTGARYAPATDSWMPISTTNAPEARALHTAVWTGSEMIVWGGASGSGLLNTGGRYNPATDTWTPISTLNAPEARALHTAVWTGTEMIVWGGESTSDILNTGARYAPATDTWTPISTTNAPEGRAYHTAVWTGTEMIVWGGMGSNTASPTVFNTGRRYNPATDTWTPISTTDAPVARALHTAVWTGTEMIVWGGTDGNTTSPMVFNTGGRYDPATDTWTPISTTGAPDARYFHTAIWTGSEMIVWGGMEGDAGSPTVLNTGGRYNPAASDSTAWTPIATTNAPEGRFESSTVWTGTEMLVWGGKNRSNEVIVTGGRYSPSNTAPSLAVIPDNGMTINTPSLTIPFTVGDQDNGAATLTVHASSSNPVLVPAENVLLAGLGADRTITIYPIAGQTGTTTITLTVSDGFNTVTGSFELTVNLHRSWLPLVTNHP